MQDCEALAKLSADIKKANLTLVLSVPEARQGCVPDGAYTVETSHTPAAALGVDEGGSDRWRAMPLGSPWDAVQMAAQEWVRLARVQKHIGAR